MFSACETEDFWALHGGSQRVELLSMLRLKRDQEVWVESGPLAGASVYAKAKVVCVDGSSVEVQARGANVTVPASDCYRVHPGDAVPDHCQLTFLSLPTMLENTRQRFMRDQIYTLVGDILVPASPPLLLPALARASTTHPVRVCLGLGQPVQEDQSALRREGDGAVPRQAPVQLRMRAARLRHR